MREEERIIRERQEIAEREGKKLLEDQKYAGLRYLSPSTKM